MQDVEPRIVEAVGTAVAPNDVPGLAEALEAIQVAAIHRAIADGISLSDGPALLTSKAAAREALHDAWAMGPEALVELFDQYARSSTHGE